MAGLFAGYLLVLLGVATATVGAGTRDCSLSWAVPPNGSAVVGLGIFGVTVAMEVGSRVAGISAVVGAGVSLGTPVTTGDGASSGMGARVSGSCAEI